MKIHAPLTGVLVPLHLVPDEAFSQKLVGDGISIDPIDSVLRSPVDGVVEFIHPSRHALTVTTADGLSLLIHIGVDTVQLKGEGFISKVKAGQKVKVGDALIEFDIDFVASSAKSLLTQVLVANSEDYEFEFNSSLKNVKAGQDFLFQVYAKKTKTVLTANIEKQNRISRKFVCALPVGFHARPAAAVVQEAKKFDCEIQLVKNGKKANAKSLVSILSLEIGKDEAFSVEVAGVDAEKALDEMTLLIDCGLKEASDLKTEKKSVPAASPLQPAGASAGQAPSHNADQFNGVAASTGLVLGKIFQANRELIQVTENLYSKNSEAESQKINSSLLQVETELKNVISKLKTGANDDQVGIFEAHLEVLKDPELVKLAHEKINSGMSAAFAWQESVKEFKNLLSSLQNEIMAGRAHDLEDVGQRVLKNLLNIKDEVNAYKSPFDETSILIAQNLTPSDMVLIDSKKIKGIVTVEGGASSHVAIIARSMGLAYVVAVSAQALNLKNGTEALLDAKSGVLKLNLTENEKTNLQKQISQQKEQDLKDLKTAATPAVTLDGHQVHVFANVGNLSDADEAVQNGAEGIGLLRSEFLFLHRNSAPDESEQIKKYQGFVDALKKQTVIIRTLDVGGDKPLSYLPLPAEENPFLGVRGLRMSLRAPEIFREQLRALLKVTPYESVKIMFPMVTTLSELLEAKAILHEECLKLNREKVSVGIMIEVPSAALMADVLAPYVDFFSIGSNDLTQYTLAIDRGHRELAAMADGLHPSVLQLIKITCDAANKHKKMVGVCGGIAGDPFAVPLLLGLGVHELSVSVPVIPNIKAQIRKLNLTQCKDLAHKALQLAEASEVRKLVENLI